MSGKQAKGGGIVVPVDGPAGSGKSTLAKRIADHLQWEYLESGAIYRAVGLSVLEMGGNPENPEEAARQARNLSFECRKTPQGWRNFLNGRDATDNLREERVSEAASMVSTHPVVREALLDFQRSYGRDGGAVIDGRDIGTVVFSAARLKFFLDADVEVRIQRRFQELREKGVDFDPEKLGASLRERDHRDRHRAQAPLIQAKDAFRLDTSKLSVDDVLRIMLDKIAREYGQLIDLR
ncbi:MAG: (d)CMP kinase [Nitrospinota bacterium]|jgi:cytidylate kinase|nr:(d)CMP kinase [Nitrospinota bacterium]MDP7663403.1 (d)CMP kinase [Nitrospinota bacterium]